MDRERPHQSALRKYRYSAHNRIYLLTTVTSRRKPVFSDLWTGRGVVNEMRQLADVGTADTLAWVLMPDHLHWLMQLGAGADLSRVVQNLKGRTARKLNVHRRTNGAVWQPAYHDHAVRRDEDLNKLARYIISNPLRTGLVTDVGAYPLWDCIWI